jgi:hypothetical protein
MTRSEISSPEALTQWQAKREEPPLKSSRRLLSRKNQVLKTRGKKEREIENIFEKFSLPKNLFTKER